MDNQYPISFVKTDILAELKKKKLISVCKNCKQTFKELNTSQLDLMKRLDKNVLVNINNYVPFTAQTFSFYDDTEIELNNFSDVCFDEFECADIQSLRAFIHGNNIKIPLSVKMNRIPISFTVSTDVTCIKIKFDQEIPVDSIQFNCYNYHESSNNISVLNSLNASMTSEFTFSITKQKFILEALLLTFQVNEKYSDLNVVLQKIQILGHFRYLSHFRHENRPIRPFASAHTAKTTKTKKKKIAKLITFSETRGVNWNKKFRTQTIKYSHSNLVGIGIKLHSNIETRAHSLIIGFYEDNHYCGHRSLMVPTEIDSNISCSYFPISMCPARFNNIVIFYLDRIPHVEPYKIMLLD